MYSESQRRAHIYDLQTFLRRIQRAGGHPSPLVPDGIFGAETAEAVRAFQRANALPATGTADYDTWTAVYAAYRVLLADDTPPAEAAFFPPGAGARLAPGDKGAAVVVLQLMLASAAAYHAAPPPAAPTGEYDRATEDAVRAAQGAFLLPQTGVTDRATWDALTRLHNSLLGRAPLAWRIAEG